MNPLVKEFYQLLVLPVFLGLGLATIYILPERGSIAESSLTMDLPLEDDLPGWYGIKKQESERERSTLAADTKFSKGDYYDKSLGSRAGLYQCNLSVVLSGADMNSSIHRPEICLPSQGHFNLMPSTRTITLDNGREVSLTRLKSQINISSDSRKPDLINSINYYVFVGNGAVTHKHEVRVLHDIYRRVLRGQDQKWAYIQAGIFYGNRVGTTEEEAVATIEKLLKALLPRIIKWEEINS